LDQKVNLQEFSYENTIFSLYFTALAKWWIRIISLKTPAELQIRMDISTVTTNNQHLTYFSLDFTVWLLIKIVSTRWFYCMVKCLIMILRFFNIIPYLEPSSINSILVNCWQRHNKTISFLTLLTFHNQNKFISIWIWTLIIDKMSVNPLPLRYVILCVHGQWLWKTLWERWNCSKQAISPFSTMFSTWKVYLNLNGSTFELSSADSFNLEQTKILLFGNGLIELKIIEKLMNTVEAHFRPNQLQIWSEWRP